jgi:EAL domain-containing protein (putative c-di-GMP-specific phosphodiesterase class I)
MQPMERAQLTLVAESELQRALDCGELIRVYQPVVDLATGEPVQVEALLRWDHPGRGLLGPSDFLVEEDDSSLLVRIGWSVVIEAARRAGEWRRAFPSRPVTVAVNLFDDHLALRDLPTRVRYLLEYNEIDDPHVLAFEVGEHHFVPSRSRTRDRLMILRNLGVDVVVDDFGVGAVDDELAPEELRHWAVERFAALRSAPLDLVKLTPRFVRALETGARLRAVVDAAHQAELRVVALAVEDDEMADDARAAGCDLGQGFHFSRPERPSRIDALLAAR